MSSWRQFTSRVMAWRCVDCCTRTASRRRVDLARHARVGSLTRRENCTRRMHIGWPQILIATAAFACGGEAAALGFGQVRSSVVLGQPLNLAIPVSLGAGETIGAGCAGAEVSYGETQLPPISVRIRVTQGTDGNESVLRVSATTVIDEPVVTVTLVAGCPTKVSRTLVLFADPPSVTVAAAPPAPTRLPTRRRPWRHRLRLKRRPVPRHRVPRARRHPRAPREQRPRHRRAPPLPPRRRRPRPRPAASRLRRVLQRRPPSPGRG